MFNQKEYNKKWRESHKEQIKAYKLKYRKTHKEEINNYREEHKEETKIYHREYMRKYRLDKFGVRKRKSKNPEIAKIKMCSYAFVKYHFNDLYNGKIHQIHHCYRFRKI